MITNSEAPTKEEREIMKTNTLPPKGYKGVVVPEAKTETQETETQETENPTPAPVTPVPTPEEPTPVPATVPAASPVPTPEVPSPDDVFVRLERELQKPDGQADLAGFNTREKAYFHQMQRDRKAKQDAIRERDEALFREAQRVKAETDATTAPPSPLDELAKRDPTDFLTVGEVTKLLKAPPTPSVPAVAPPGGLDPVQTRFLTLCDAEARSLHPEDYDAVMELVPDLISKSPEHLKSLADAYRRGENVADVTYTLIRRDPAFETLWPVAQTRSAAKRSPMPPTAPVKEPPPVAPPPAPSAAASSAQLALDTNANKPKTTGHAPSGSDTPPDQLTLDQIAAMSQREFGQLPKRTRDAFLKRYGGGPPPRYDD